VRTALDTNILSALWSREPLASQISARLADLYSEGGLVICGHVYVELYANPYAKPSVREGFIDQFLSKTGITVEFDLSESIWHSAAKGFGSYASRRRHSGGGTPKRLPVDFLIAAHASFRADQLMTLDSRPYKEDFPGLRLLTL
jgi:predicted nucleic acid-binding protein